MTKVLARLITPRWLVTGGQEDSVYDWVLPGGQIWKCRVEPWACRNFLSDTKDEHCFTSCPHVEEEQWRLVYVGWSFCRAEMFRGGGARPLHSWSWPSLKKRLRAGRGTPDSAGGWLRGFDTPLSASKDWLPSCHRRGEGHTPAHQVERVRRTEGVKIRLLTWSLSESWTIQT